MHRESLALAIPPGNGDQGRDLHRLAAAPPDQARQRVGLEKLHMFLPVADDPGRRAREPEQIEIRRRKNQNAAGTQKSQEVGDELPGLEEVTLHGGVNPPWIFSLAAFLGNLGLTTTHARRERMTKMLVPLLGLFAATGPDKSVFRIDVYGSDKGRPVHRHYTGVGHIAFITSIPAVTAAVWLLKGIWDDLPGGVYSADRICEPDPFLDELARRGVELHYHE